MKKLNKHEINASDVCQQNQIFETEDNELITQTDHGQPNQLSQPYNWTVLLAVNTGYVDFFHNWYFHFRSLQLRVPVVVIAEDDNCFLVLRSLYNCSITIEKGYAGTLSAGKETFQNSLDFRTLGFNKLVGKRPSNILKLLKLNKNVLVCDVDTVWLQNPFPHFIGNFDIWAQHDSDEFCTGFLAIKCNHRTIQLMKDWQDYMHDIIIKIWPLGDDQFIFNRLDLSGLCIHGLSLNAFPQGYDFFCAPPNDKRFDEVVVFHNNRIVGHDKKRDLFIKYNHWYNNTSDANK